MTSRQKRLRIPAALAFVLLGPGALSCSGSAGSCDYDCTPIAQADAGAIDGGASPCAVAGDPRLTDPRWSCISTGIT